MSLLAGEGESASPAAPVGAGSGLGRVTALMALGTLLSRLTGLLRLLVAAYALGGNFLSDAFNLANNTPNIVHDLVLGGVLSATFVPQFVHRLATRPREEAVESISAVVSLSSVVLLAATVAFLLLAPYIIDLYSIGAHSASLAAERQVATELLRLFAIQLIAYGAISLMGAVLNTVRRFLLVAYVAVLNNVVAIAVLLEFAHIVGHHPTLARVQHDHGLLLLLGLGTSAGVLVQALALLPAAMRSGLRLRFVWRPDDPAIKEILSLSGWTFGFVVANQVAVFVVLALAVGLGASRVTDYTYAYQFFQLPFGMIAVSVMSTVIPELAYRYSTHNLAEMAHQFGLGLRRMMAGILPATAGYLLLAGPLVALLLRHGAFGAASSHETGQLLALLAVGLPGYCTYLLCISALQAMRDTRTAFFLYLFENGVNVILAVVLSRHIGARGLSLSLSVAYSASAVAALVIVRQRMGGLGGRRVARYVARSLALTLIMAAAVAAVTAAIASPTETGLLLRVSAGVLAGIVTYGAAAGLAGTVADWQTARKRRLGARRGAHGYDPSRH
ncbi:MAG TPA: murein biosynthesis integral membrane protein MurJ [Acidimicrobiales bacterium]|nr:murein biosynthesis integral membrane protein MurJ [Acidimicrobiales bacterium]